MMPFNKCAQIRAFKKALERSINGPMLCYRLAADDDDRKSVTEAICWLSMISNMTPSYP